MSEIEKIEEYDVRMVVEGKVITKGGHSEAIQFAKKMVLPGGFYVVSARVFDQKEVKNGR